MYNLFPAEFFANNRRALQSKIASDAPIIVTANGQLQRRGDSTYDFVQDASFWYLTGLDVADLILVIDAGTEYLITPELSSYQDIFDGSLSSDQMTARSGITSIYAKREGWTLLRKRLRTTKTIATLLPAPAFVPLYGMYINPSRSRLVRRLKSSNGQLEIIDLRAAMAGLRSIKQAVELQAMQAAIDLTIGALSLVHRDLDSYQYSYEIEAAISHHIISHGGLDAWTPIIGAGKNSCILHSSERRTRLQRNDLVVIDIGADVEHYCADITRSYVLGGKPSMRQQAVYDAVLETHSYGCSLQQPGSLIRENERLVEAFIGRKMMALGLITQSERSAIRKYFPHATSHYLGLDPHDAGDYDQPLQAGMVVTVEPGIYIPEEEIGIRIEDDVLITESGNVIMSEGIPRTLS